MDAIPSVESLVMVSRELASDTEALLECLELNKQIWERDFAIRKIQYLFAKDLLQYVGRGVKQIKINIWSRDYTNSVFSFEEVIEHLCLIATTKGYTVISKEFPFFIIACLTPEELKVISQTDEQNISDVC